MYKILFVCMGNICRSPTAEGVMQKLINDADLAEEIQVDSAGTASYHHGDRPDWRSIECADNHQVDLRGLRSRPVRAEDFSEFDLILAMDENNFADLHYRRPLGDARYEKAAIKKLLDFAPEYGENVPDPYYENGFERVFTMIETACKNLLTEYSNSER